MAAAADSARTLTLIEAFAEIMNVPAPRLAIILAKAKKDLGVQ